MKKKVKLKKRPKPEEPKAEAKPRKTRAEPKTTAAKPKAKAVMLPPAYSAQAVRKDFTTLRGLARKLDGAALESLVGFVISLSLGRSIVPRNVAAAWTAASKADPEIKKGFSYRGSALSAAVRHLMDLYKAVDNAERALAKGVSTFPSTTGKTPRKTAAKTPRKKTPKKPRARSPKS